METTNQAISKPQLQYDFQKTHDLGLPRQTNKKDIRLSEEV